MVELLITETQRPICEPELRHLLAYEIGSLWCSLRMGDFPAAGGTRFGYSFQTIDGADRSDLTAKNVSSALTLVPSQLN